ncbi:MAG: [FeFe] hydrogenase H-cluster radical SAM maturase HydG [Candidatus Omnitrophica bacterium]|nr:[FeFe] hydrogenase H-cluster radical SAM maturase HydG [Candidatus Omnitrophota bacterium]
MKLINEEKIHEALKAGRKAGRSRIMEVLEKSAGLNRLSIEDAAVLLAAEGPGETEAILAAASEVKRKIYGDRVVLFAPLYINNICANACSYCAFKEGNELIPRKKLAQPEIAAEARSLLKMGHKRVLLVASESGSPDDAGYFAESIGTIYSQTDGKNRIRRINVNCAPLEKEGFKRLKASGIGTYQLFQETYHERTYRKVHPRGPKSDPDERLAAIDRAFEAGIDDVGIGALFGLYDHRFEALGLLTHVEYLEKKFNIGPHTVSVPRVEPAKGVDLSEAAPFEMSDREFMLLVAVLRLAVPYTGIILSTRESPEMRDALFDLGVSQISASSRTSPGGYAEPGQACGQFSLNDHRSLDQVVGALIGKGAVPSFCTACYRSRRTGEAFMEMARPGTIKGKCRINALITLKEYLDDYASDDVRAKGYALVEKLSAGLGAEEKETLEKILLDLAKGKRDEFV